LTYFDSVIVGGGTAGAILASRLSEDPARSVCVLEAGQDYASVDVLPPGVRSHRSARGMTSRNDPNVLGFPDWGLRARFTALQPDVHVPRGRVIGGSSSVNGGVFLRALREDLDEWVALGLPLWSFDACLPYFKRLETDHDFPTDDHGEKGPIPVHRAHQADWVALNRAFYAACRQLGYPDCPDFNRPDAWGVGPLPVNIHDYIRVSSAVGYLMPVRERPNLTVVGNANARRLVVNKNTVSAVEVEVSGEPRRIEGGHIIVAAGAIGSPQLLMLSGIGPRADLEAVGVKPLVDLPGVGQNLRDHPVLCALWAADSNVELPTAPPGTPGQLGLRATTPASTDPQDLRLVSFRAEGAQRFGIPYSLMHALSQGRVELASNDPRTPPRIDFRHLEHPSDMQRMHAMLQVVDDIVRQPAYDGLRLERVEPLAPCNGSPTRGELERWMLQTVITGHHASATCKMGPASDPMAVVDQTGRVFGLDNLRIADASIMPDCPHVNINATTMMLAERIADFVRSEDQSSRTLPTSAS
jgi:choline dehydrogenase